MSGRGMKMLQGLLRFDGAERATYELRFPGFARRVTADSAVSVTWTDEVGHALLCDHDGYPFSSDEVDAVELEPL